MGISTKKFLTIILSISLLFLVSCGDRPTGSDTGGSGKGDALLSSVPKATGTPLSEDATDFSGTTTYTGTLNIDETGLDFTGDFMGKTKKDFIEEMKKDSATMEFILTVTGNKLTLKENTASGDIFFENKILSKDGNKYNADIEENDSGGGNYMKTKNYIEFTKSTDNKITGVKFVKGYSYKGKMDHSDDRVNWITIDVDYGMITTYTGDLTKQVN